MATQTIDKNCRPFDRGLFLKSVQRDGTFYRFSLTGPSNNAEVELGLKSSNYRLYWFDITNLIASCLGSYERVTTGMSRSAYDDEFWEIIDFIRECHGIR